MKKKTINKISKKIISQLNAESNKKKKVRSYEEEIAVKQQEEEYICEYDEEISTRFKKLFNNIIQYPDNIRLTHTSTYINIEIGDIRYIKKRIPSQGSGLVKVSGDEQLSIYIFKDKYFTLTYGYTRQTKYSDTNMYNELIDIVKDKVKEINANNFNSIWENISKESGILRDSNLNEIFNEVS